jgi:hypothetical protein
MCDDVSEDNKLSLTHHVKSYTVIEIKARNNVCGTTHKNENRITTNNKYSTITI